MNLIKLFLLFLLPLFQITWVTTVFAAYASEKQETKSPVILEKNIHPEDKLLICMSFRVGELNSARKDGIRLYGSVENFYSQMHEIQCPPNAPSPIYVGMDFDPTADGYPQMFRDLAKLAPDVRARLLNRPTSGRRTETILDLLDRRMKRAIGQHELMDFYEQKRRKFVELGAKKVSEMTPVEISVYE